MKIHNNIFPAKFHIVIVMAIVLALLKVILIAQCYLSVLLIVHVCFSVFEMLHVYFTLFVKLNHNIRINNTWITSRVYVHNLLNVVKKREIARNFHAVSTADFGHFCSTTHGLLTHVLLQWAPKSNSDDDVVSEVCVKTFYCGHNNKFGFFYKRHSAWVVGT